MRIIRFFTAALLCWIAASTAYSQSASPYQAALPQIAYGGGWETKIVITNLSSTPEPVTLNYYDGAAATNGQPLMVPFGGVPTSQQSLTIPANGQQEIVPDFQGSTLFVGWAGITYNELSVKIQGVFIQGTNQAVAPIVSLSQPCIIGFPTSAPLAMPFDQTGPADSAYAFANTLSTPVAMTLTFYDQNGNSIGPTPPLQIQIPGFGHTQFDIRSNSQLQQLSNTKGTMQIAGAGVVPLGFKFSSGPIFTTWLP